MQKARPAWDLLDTYHRDLGNQPQKPGRKVPVARHRVHV